MAVAPSLWMSHQLRRLEIGCRVDLRRRVVALQRALEGRAARDTSSDGTGVVAALRLLQRANRSVAVVGVVVVKAVTAVPGRLLALVDAEGHEANNNKDNGATDTDNDTNDSVARRRRHARRLAAVAVRGQAARGRRRRLSRHSRRGAIRLRVGRDKGARRDGPRGRRRRLVRRWRRRRRLVCGRGGGLVRRRVVGRRRGGLGVLGGGRRRRCRRRRARVVRGRGRAGRRRRVARRWRSRRGRGRRLGRCRAGLGRRRRAGRGGVTRRLGVSGRGRTGTTFNLFVGVGLLGEAEEVLVETQGVGGDHEGQRHEEQLHQALGVHDGGCVESG